MDALVDTEMEVSAHKTDMCAKVLMGMDTKMELDARNNFLAHISLCDKAYSLQRK